MSPGLFWRLRLGLFGLGAGLLVTGAVLLLGRPTGPRLVGIVVWLGCAIVLHDAILVPVLTIAGRLRDASGRRVGLPRAAMHVVDAALAVGGVLTLAVLPELWAQHRGPANPTVLPGDYGPRLLAVWIALAVLAAAGVILVTLRARRRPAAAR
jgi:hypothetical protein